VATQRNAPEAKLKAQMEEAQQAAKAAQAKLQAALKLKQKYKQQVGLAETISCPHSSQRSSASLCSTRPHTYEQLHIPPPVLSKLCTCALHVRGVTRYSWSFQVFQALY
jgi:hypothetical protein